MSIPPATTATKFFRITLIRSALGLPAKSSNVLKALGLRKTRSTVYHPVTQDTAGQIMKVKELVAVSEVDRAKTKAEQRFERSTMGTGEVGYYVEKRGGRVEE
ncbi:MAG: hypothetical protein Q9160_003994 [Pyrenula sp. 1 TL-2023]